MHNFFSQIDINKLSDNKYIFDANPSPNGLYQYLAIIFGLMVITGIILTIYPKSRNAIQKKLFSKLIYLLITIGILGLVWNFSRSQSLAYIDSRVALIILFIVFCIWSLNIIFYEVIIAPKEYQKIKEKEKFEKYLPRAKSRGQK